VDPDLRLGDRCSPKLAHRTGLGGPPTVDVRPHPVASKDFGQPAQVVLVRVGQQRLSKRGQKFRRLLGLKRYNISQINDQKN